MRCRRRSSRKRVGSWLASLTGFRPIAVRFGRAVVILAILTKRCSIETIDKAYDTP